LLALVHLNEKLRFKFSFMSLHINCLGFNSLIFRSTGKFVTPFLSIGSEVTTFFIFSKFAFLPSETASLLFSSVVYWTNGGKEQRATNPIPHPCTDKKSQYLRAPRCYILSIRVKDSPCAPFSVGSPPAQLSASLRVLRFALALRVCWSGTLPTEVVARGKNPDCRVFTRPS
jgi:hypothetical protein